jgi:hypothetical protein
MRGDSVRDLYAKALALIGLAVLAGAGALMDYWPVQGTLPAVSFNYSLPSGPGALEARVALASPVAKAVAAPSVAAAAIVAAPLPAPAPDPTPVEVPVVIVAADEPVAPPVMAQPVADPIQTTVASVDVDMPISTAPEPMAPPKVSHSEELALPASTNVLQKAGGQVLNAGFALGTGVAKSFSAFGTAFSNIGKLFSPK